MLNKKHCRGCYRDPYNYGLGGAHECWSRSDAKIVWRRPIHKNDPYHVKRKKVRVPDCFSTQDTLYSED